MVDQMQDFINYITSIQIVDILIALFIIIFFKIFSSTFSYIIVKMFKFKTKNKAHIKENAFYNPLRIFFTILGVYLGILFLKKPLNITNEIMSIITKIFEIIVTFAFAKGLASSFRTSSSLVKRLRKTLNTKLDDNMFEFMLKVVRVIIYVIAVFIVIAILGINLNGLVAGLGIGGIIVTLAAQDTAKNLFGGLIIFIDKPFNVGDWVQFNNFEGTIEDITFRSTRIRTFENSVVNVPNSIISEASVTNWSKMEKRRYKTNLCVESNTTLEKLQKFETRIREMLQAREAIYDDSIIVKFDQITQNGINILVYTYTDSVDYESYLAEVENINLKIMKILKEEDIKLAYESRNVYIKS